jgi:diaminopimelate epimerase
MAKKTISFTKMVGAGNDFLVIQVNRNLDYKKLALSACHRTNGIGADGILLLDKSKTADYRMRIINADGSEAEMCGNGARCLAAYIVHYKKPAKKLFSIETLAGLILGMAKGEIARVRLSDPTDYRPNISVNLNDKNLHVHYIDTGVPHTIVYVNGLADIAVNTIGSLIRYHKTFKPRGTNVNFVEQMTENCVAVRTYERGVEGETRACGTGSVAAAIVSYLQSNPNALQLNQKKARMNVLTQSGETLEVTFDIAAQKMTNVWLKGSAKFIAEGSYFS